jgi:hypothetical protein
MASKAWDNRDAILGGVAKHIPIIGGLFGD